MTDQDQAVEAYQPAYPAPTQYQPPQSPLPPVTEYKARLTPNAPLGHPGSTDGAAMAEIGARLGAMGVEKGAVTALLHQLQLINIQISMSGMPVILDLVQDLIKSRINTVMQGVQTLPVSYMPLPGIRGLLGTARPEQMNATAYVSKDQVLNLLAAASVRPASTN